MFCVTIISMEEMYTFKWDISMSVGEDSIDKQHQQLLAEINTLLDAILNRHSEDKVEDTIRFLDDYIDKHFSYEEQYMSEIGYPDREAHIAMHREFTKKYNNFKSELKATGVTSELAMEVQSYMGQWWMSHIKKEDKKYHLYIIAREE